jgi:hypothetical protein
MLAGEWIERFCLVSKINGICFQLFYVGYGDAVCFSFEAGSEITDRLEGCYFLGGFFLSNITYCSKNCSLFIQSLHIIKSVTIFEMSKRHRQELGLGFVHWNAEVMARGQFAFGRSYNQVALSGFVFLGPRANADLVPKGHIALHASRATLPVLTKCCPSVAVSILNQNFTVMDTTHPNIDIKFQINCSKNPVQLRFVWTSPSPFASSLPSPEIW